MSDSPEFFSVGTRLWLVDLSQVATSVCCGLPQSSGIRELCLSIQPVLLGSIMLSHPANYE